MSRGPISSWHFSAVIVCVIFTNFVFAGKETDKKAHKLHTAIFESREKILERKRSEAIEILLKAITTEGANAKNQELKDELNRQASLFFTDEGQRAFELANAIRFSGQQNFMPKYIEALKFEPMNWDVLLNQAIGFLIMKNCKQALEAIGQAQATNPYRFESGYIAIRAQLCLNEKVTDTALRELKPATSDLHYKSALEAQYFEFISVSDLAKSSADAAIAADKNYPMGYYWAWRATKVEPVRAIFYAQKYLEVCKTITPQIRRAYYLNHDLCIETEAVEAFLEGASKQNEE